MTADPAAGLATSVKETTLLDQENLARIDVAQAAKPLLRVYKTFHAAVGNEQGAILGRINDLA